MRRRVLLIEPNYKNKYPPLNLMKLSWYFRRICGDDVRFFKGNLRQFAAQLLIEEFFNSKENVILKFEPENNSNPAELFGAHYENLVNFIKVGKHFYLDNIPNLRGTAFEYSLFELRRRFKRGDYPKFDIICVNSLFTFYWAKTIDTINFAKKFLADGGQIFVGGIAATLVPAEMQAEIGENVKIHIGLLDKPTDLKKSDSVIIDELPPDYSILEETDYKYPARNAYFGYTTRGCIRRCSFCAVSTLEPIYKDYVNIQTQLQITENFFGKKQNLLLMDNNVLASEKFSQIVEDIKNCGFGKDSTYILSDEYDLSIKNLRADFNNRAYIKKIICLYEELEKKLPEVEAGKFYLAREQNFLLHFITATKEKILEFDSMARPLFQKYFKQGKRTHYVDFNQGLDARLATEENMAKLAELNIRPLRIAFDHYEQKEIYEKAILLAAKFGIRHMSNYVLYNFHDKPEELYLRLKLNIELCEELGVAIYSFPMKYHPIKDPKYFRNRDYLGEHWNKKFIRAIQAIINSTKGKIGRGRSFFEKAFGKNLEEFHDLLWMPEAMIIYRLKHEKLAEEWRKFFHSLNKFEVEEAQKIIAQNKFTDSDISNAESETVRQFLKFYKITRTD